MNIRENEEGTFKISVQMVSHSERPELIVRFNLIQTLIVSVCRREISEWVCVHTYNCVLFIFFNSFWKQESHGI